MLLKFVAIFVVLVSAVLLNGQTVDTAILGEVVDAAQASIPNAEVTITQSATGVTRTVRTNAEGIFELRYLVPGEYVVEVKAEGFRSEKRTGIAIQIGQQAKISFLLQVGSVQQTLEVQATAPLLQTQDATLAGVVSSNRITNLPLNGRKFNDLAILTPGVQVSNPDNHSSSTAGSTIASNGGRPTWGQVNVDGITMVNNRSNYVNLFPSIDAIQEFKVQTGNYSAEYGGNAGTNVNVQIKSGTNQVHGDLFEFFRNHAMDARNYFLPSPLPQNILKQNQFGATVGGPVIKDKTFFFLSYERIRSISESPSTAIVLTPAQRRGDFSASSTPIVDPLTDRPFVGNVIPQPRLNPVATAIVNQYMPTPNVSSGDINYAGSSLGDETVDQGIVRIDHYFSEKDQLFGHYIGAHRSFPNRDLNPNFSFTGEYPMHNFQVQYIHTFNPSFINEFRAGFDLENVSQLSRRTNTSFTLQSLGINGMNVGGPNGRPLRADEQGFPLLNISGYLGMGDDLAASNLDNSRTFQFVDNVIRSKGAHTLKFGGDVRRVRDDATTNNWPFGSLSFTSDIANNSAAAYMLGYPRTVLTPEGVPITASRQTRLALYGQDDWKVSPRLTINLGLRWDFFQVPTDVNGVTRTLLFPAGGVPTFYPDPGQINHSLWDQNYKDFSPRIGLAYRIRSNTAIRAGYGMFYFGGQFDNINILQLNPPNGGSLTITNPSLNPIATINNPIPAALYPANPIFNAVTLPPDRRHPDTYLQSWNLQISRQFGASNLLEVAYVGNKGTHLDTSFKNFNQPAPGPGDIQPRRPYPTVARIRMQHYGANLSYNALQLRYERRMAKGVSATIAYAYSHTIDDTGETTNNGGCLCQLPTRQNERANSLYDQRQNLVISFVWELPFVRTRSGFTGLLFGGWAVEGIVAVASGSPFDVLQSFDGQNNDGLWERPNLVPGQRLSVANQGPANWFNTSAFVGSIYQYGTSPRNPLVGPATKNLNLSLRKNFKMPYSEAQNLEFRAEAFNAFNTPQFSNPDSNLGDGSFGRVTSTKNDNRLLQLALKYYF
jgi:outer membrane receptor protein involved in Fe transport